MAPGLLLSASFVLLWPVAYAQSEGTANDAKAPSTGREVEGFTLSLSSNQTTYKPGEMIKAQVVLTNVSTEKVTFSMGSEMEKFHFEVVLPNKEVAPLTLYGKKLQRVPMFSYKTAYLPPEETIDVEFPMNRLFDMTLSGNYTIKIVTSVSVRADREKLAEVSSNSIQVVVKE